MRRQPRRRPARRCSRPRSSPRARLGTRTRQSARRTREGERSLHARRPDGEGGATTTQVEFTRRRLRHRLVRARPRAGNAACSRPARGEDAVDPKVTWTRRQRPDRARTRRSRSSRSPRSSKTYTFHVRQTYSDGSSSTGPGPESSDTPAPTSTRSPRSAAAAARRSRSSRSSSARSALCSAASALFCGREARARVTPRGRIAGRWSPRGSARPAAACVGARRSDEDGPGGERRSLNAPPQAGRADLQRGGRAAVRHRLRDRRRGAPADGRAPAPLAGEPRHAARPAQAHARGLVPRLLARDLGRRPPRAGRVHVCGRAERRPRAAVPDPVDVGDRGDAALLVARWVVVPRGDGGDRAPRPPARDRAAARAARRGARACARVSIAFCIASAVGLVAIPVYLALATADFALRSVFAVGALVPLFRVSAFGRGYLDLEICFALFVAAAALALWLDRPEREQRSIAELLCARRASPLAAARRSLVPGASGHAGADLASRSFAAARLGPPGLRLALARRPPRAARPLAEPRRRSRVAGPRRRACPASRTSRSARCCVLITSGIVAVVLHMPTARGALADLVRPGDPGEDRPARSRRWRSPRSTCCARRRALGPRRDGRAGRRPRLLRRAVSG